MALYTRKSNIHGWPDFHVTPAMLSVADDYMSVELWRWLAHTIIVRANLGDQTGMPPLGNFRLQEYGAETIKTTFPPYLVTVPTRRTLRFRPSRALLRYITRKTPLPSFGIPSILNDAAEAAMVPRSCAADLWPLMAARLFAVLRGGSSFETVGFGTFKTAVLPARYYRHRWTKELKYCNSRTVAAFYPSHLCTTWLTAYTIPDPIDP